MSPLAQPERNIYGLALMVGALFAFCLFMVAVGFAEPTTIAPVILAFLPTLFLLTALIKVSSRNPIFPIIGAVGAFIGSLIILYPVAAELLHPDRERTGGELAIALSVEMTTLTITIIIVVLAIFRFEKLRNIEVTPWQQ